MKTKKSSLGWTSHIKENTYKLQGEASRGENRAVNYAHPKDLQYPVFLESVKIRMAIEWTPPSSDINKVYSNCARLIILKWYGNTLKPKSSNILKYDPNHPDLMIYSHYDLKFINQYEIILDKIIKNPRKFNTDDATYTEIISHDIMEKTDHIGLDNTVNVSFLLLYQKEKSSNIHYSCMFRTRYRTYT